MKLVKYDANKGIMLSAPDIEEFYDTMLEPYRLAYEFKLRQPATAPVTPPAGEAPEDKPAEPPKPTADDRLDISGDAGTGNEVDLSNPDEALDDLFKE